MHEVSAGLLIFVLLLSLRKLVWVPVVRSEHVRRVAMDVACLRVDKAAMGCPLCEPRRPVRELQVTQLYRVWLQLKEVLSVLLCRSQEVILVRHALIFDTFIINT